MPRQLALLNLVLLLVAAGSVAYIVREVTSPPRPMPLRPRVAVTEPLPRTETSATPTITPGAYGVVASKNLFSPTRSEAPPAATTQANRPVVALPKPTLHGVILRDGTPIAYLEDPTTKRVASYRLGDNVAGGTVRTINADHVVLMRPEGAVDVRLRDPAKPRPAVAGPAAGAPSPTSPLAGGATGLPVPGATLPGIPGATGFPQQIPQPGVATPITPPDQVQPGVPLPPRRPLPPNLLRRVPPTTPDAQR